MSLIRRRVVIVVVTLVAVAAISIVGWFVVRPGPDLVQGEVDATEVKVASKLPARVLEIATLDRNPAVAVLVINAARSAGLPARSQTRDLRHNSMWYLELVDWMQDNHWLDITTDRGTFRIRLDSLETPITAREVYDLAAAGFYDGLDFHRVVPNFVVQGGDPRGDG